MSLEKLKQAFVTALELELSDVKDDLAYSEHEKWDSTAHMVLIAEIENQFDVMLDTDDIIAMSSFAVAKEILAKQGIDC